MRRATAAPEHHTPDETAPAPPTEAGVRSAASVPTLIAGTVRTTGRGAIAGPRAIGTGLNVPMHRGATIAVDRPEIVSRAVDRRPAEIAGGRSAPTPAVGRTASVRSAGLTGRVVMRGIDVSTVIADTITVAPTVARVGMAESADTTGSADTTQARAPMVHDALTASVGMTTAAPTAGRVAMPESAVLTADDGSMAGRDRMAALVRTA